MVRHPIRHAAAVAAAAALIAATPAAATAAIPPDREVTAVTPAPVSGLGRVGSGEPADVVVLRETVRGPQISTVPVTGREAAVATADRERVDPGVLAVSVDRPVRQLGTIDPLRKRQWGIRAVHATAAWSSTTGVGITVAVVDSGVDGNHRDLVGAVAAGYNARHDRGDWSSAARDANGHGTHVAGIIAARANNGIGVVGVAPRARILPVKVLDSDGTGWMSDVTEGIVWAVNHGADVINMSLGGADATFMAPAVRYAISRGVTVVAASGNEGSSRPNYPAALPGVISVGALSEDGPLASWSNRGSTLDVVAPGTDIWSTVPGGYAAMDGTSMAAPYVAGIAALIRAENERADVLTVLRGTSSDRGAAGRDDRYGWGLVDADAAVDRACNCRVASGRLVVQQTIADVREVSVGKARRLPRRTEQGMKARWTTRSRSVCAVERHDGRSVVTGREAGRCRLAVKARGTDEVAALSDVVTLRVNDRG